jgi:hypothetical protein
MNRYEIALQVLENLNPEISGNFERREEAPVVPMQTQYPLAKEGLRLEEYISAITPLPELTILFGRCEDGLPLLMDLEDPSSGAILINSRSKDHARYLLRSVLTSAILMNGSHQVQYSLITSQPDLFGRLLFQAHCHKNFHPNQREAGQHVLDISALVEQRYSGRRRGPALLVSIDDLEAFERGSLDEEVFSHLQWIIHEGPAVSVWPVVAADLEGRGSFGAHLIKQFGTKVFEINDHTSGHAPEYGSGHPPGYRPSFEISIGAETLRFSVPVV